MAEIYLVSARPGVNAGDRFSKANLYFPFEATPIDQFAASTYNWGPTDIVILCGGGMIMSKTRPMLEGLAKLRTEGGIRRLIVWGIGLNAKEFSKVFLQTLFSSADLVGIRDSDLDIPWVPCPSCMSPAFDVQRPAPVHSVVVYGHHNAGFPLWGKGFPRMCNGHPESVGEALDFFATGEVVVTRSYHGAYWASLLGRKVIAMPPKIAKFRHMRTPPMLVREAQWRQAVSKAVVYPRALEDARDANTSFWQKVKQMILGAP